MAKHRSKNGLSDLEYFNARYEVASNGCWEWVGYVHPHGYGDARRGKKQKRYAHRLSYELFNGPVGELHVLHKCDNRRCVNPDHLILGTNLDNIADMHRKGRNAKGTMFSRSKLNESDVVAIRKDDRPQSIVAAQYGVDQSHVSDIRNRKKWRWLEEKAA